MRFEPSARKGVPAHITVLYPFLQPAAITRDIEVALQELFAATAPFDFALTQTRRFGTQTLYLTPEPPGPFVDLTLAVWDRFPNHRPYRGEFSEIIPHLSVVICEEPGSCDDPVSIMRDVEHAIVPSMPVKCRAPEVWLMEGDERWRVRQTFPLAVEIR